jgi:solute:Na+ symporter, SSS family
MPTLDLAIIAAYFAGTILLGAWFSRRQKDLKYYFVSGRDLPWWVIMASIVSTETSAVTFISVPGYAFGTDYTFLQLPMGYIVGRVMVSFIFVPAYFRGEVLTVYQLLEGRFGGTVKQLASGLFLVTRTLSDGFRLFATALVLAALFVAMPGVRSAVQSLMPATDPTTALLVAAVAALGVAMIVYTFLGGMTALIWTDVIQLAIYLIGALASAFILWQQIPGRWDEISRLATVGHKLRVFDFALDLTRGYTFWSGVIGGAFLTTATHGTDQFMVQRYLCSDSERSARKALLISGVFVFVQFALFLAIGTLLYVFYATQAPGELASLTIDGRVAPDRVFPQFIVTHLPPGLMGLVVAAILAAAMSSSLNASAAAALADFYQPLTGGRRSERHYLNASRLFTIVFGLFQIVVGLAAIRISRRIVDEVLGIASFTNGVILGVFLLGTFTVVVGRRGACVGMAIGALVMLAVRVLTAVNWQWYVLIGSMATLVAGVAVSRLFGERERVPGAA